MTESRPPAAHGVRYSSRPFPAYRYVPRDSPHPRRHPSGHSYGQPEPIARCLPPNHWQQADDYLYGIDLYNFAYWWESHEVFEAFWHAAGHQTEQGHFFQALIQLAAANIKLVQGNVQATRTLLQRGRDHFQFVPALYLGIDVKSVTEALQACCNHPQPQAPYLELHIRR